MAYLNNHGVKIYYEVEGHGPPILLAHGGTGDTTYWRGYGYVDRLVDDYTVILFDARGHGKSDKPHLIDEYEPKKMAEDAVAILDALKINIVHFWGYSMGGYTGFYLAYLYPKRIKSVIVGGSHPYEMDGSDLLGLFQLGIEEGADEVVKAMQKHMDVSPQFEQRLRSLDFQAQAACVQGSSNRKSLAEQLPSMKMPFLLYAGDQDGDYLLAKKAAPILPNAELFGLPNLDHGSTSGAVELIIPKVKTFLAEIA
ncbi:MAG: alpha/beta hydrolase [Ardenticatenaceae bacterium]|nr:alpha/beta hydrolase [Anaerolineales bacterium]MCB8940492.1 alpha/beta hydrolase [Ardenticatenaceae bacterium]MCB8973513.1 alpha/beta hydrolase [Ardenticatenaceae bacterium]